MIVSECVLGLIYTYIQQSVVGKLTFVQTYIHVSSMCTIAMKQHVGDG